MTTPQKYQSPVVLRVLQKSGHGDTPVFKTPMSFSPRCEGQVPRPSQSKFERWRQELGLDENADPAGDVSSNSDDEPEVDRDANKAVCTLVEYQALQRELKERNSQRDELMYQCLNDNNKTYKSKLEKEEMTKKQMVTILEGTHKAQLHEKDSSIAILKELIEEMREQIDLNASVTSQSNPPATSESVEPGALDLPAVGKLVEQLVTLQREHALTLKEVEVLRLEGANRLEQDECTLASLRIANEKLARENSDLQSDLITLKTSYMEGQAERDRRLAQLERDNRQLQRHQTDSPATPRMRTRADTRSQARQDELESVKQQMEELKSKFSEMQERETSHLEKITCLTRDNDVHARHIRDLNIQLTTAQSRAPDVITKVERVEVDSSAMKRELQQTAGEVARLTGLVSGLESEKTRYEAELRDARDELYKMSDLETEVESNALEIQKYQASHLEMTERLEAEKRNCAAFKDKANAVSSDLCGIKTELETLRSTHEHDLAQLKHSHESQLSNLRSSLGRAAQTAQAQFRVLKQEYTNLRQLTDTLPQLVQSAFATNRKQICEAVRTISHENEELNRKFRKEMHLRKKYHNELVELKGNIRVLCRVRPPIKEDGGSESVVVFDEDDADQVYVAYKGRLQQFELDSVFKPEVTQQQVFAEVSALVTSCVDGYNVCIFAYGQTGSGKTYTMEGSAADPGINQRALELLFKETADRNEWTYNISVSVLEIYNEQVRDLLSADPASKLDVRMDGDGGLYVPGLVRLQVDTRDDINQVFAVGQENRQTACTNMNEHSSRSHALLCILVQGTNLATGAKSTGKLNLVDLAGSERVHKSGADGARLKEAQNINKSLSSLGDVIQSLRSKNPHIPYRNSKLTYLLQDSLGGDSKTLMIVQVSPVEKNVAESVASLSFASRVRTVELGQATRKTESAEIQELKEKLAQYEDHSRSATRSQSMKTPRRK